MGRKALIMLTIFKAFKTRHANINDVLSGSYFRENEQVSFGAGQAF